MIVLAHIVIALSSLVFTTYLYIRPSHKKFYAAYGLVAATLLSGTYLVVHTRSPLVGACTSGLLYLGIVSAGLMAAYRKLAHEKAD